MDEKKLLDLLADGATSGFPKMSSSCPDHGPQRDGLAAFASDPGAPRPLSSSCPAATLSASCRDNDWPPVSSSCPRSDARVEHDGAATDATLWHAFSDKEVANCFAQPECHAVVSHGGSRFSAPGVATVCLAVEHAPVFLHVTHPLQDLATADLVSVLRGEVRSWRDLRGGPAGPVQLYLHGGELQRRKFLVLAQGLQVSPEQLASAEPRFLATYQELESAARNDRQALVMGLKTCTANTLKLVTIDGQMPCVRGTNYPLTLQIDFLHRGSEAALRFQQMMVERLGDGRRAFIQTHAG